MKIKLFVQAPDLHRFLTGKSKTLSANVYQDTPYNIEIEVDLDKTKLTPSGFGSVATFYVISRKAGWKGA